MGVPIYPIFTFQQIKILKVKKSWFFHEEQARKAIPGGLILS